jgi:hypothetical protein
MPRKKNRPYSNHIVKPRQPKNLTQNMIQSEASYRPYYYTIKARISYEVNDNSIGAGCTAVNAMNNPGEDSLASKRVALAHGFR